MARVKGKQELCRSELKYFKSVQGIGKFKLYDRYAALDAVVKSRISPEYQHFLTYPLVDADSDSITWYSIPYMDTLPRRWADLNHIEKEKYENIKNNTIDHFTSIINNLKRSGENIDAEYLEGATKFIDDRFIYCFDDKIVLGIWGMQLKEHLRESLGECVKDSFQPKSREEKIDDDIKEPPLLGINEEKPEENEIREEDNFDEIIDITSTLHRVTYLPGEYGQIEGQQFIEKEYGSVLNDHDIPSVKPFDGYKFIGWNKDPYNHEVKEDVNFVACYERINKSQAVTGKQPWYKRFWIWLGSLFSDWGWSRSFFWKKGWLKWLLGLLLLLLLLFLLFFLLKDCKGGGIFTGDDDGYKYLPPESGIIAPIDSTDIGKSPDGPNIVLDRLNILIEGDVAIPQFALDFKKAYPADQYSIVYYDTLIKRVQIKVPVAERETIKRELPAKLPQYELFIWDEMLFEGFLMPNDPALTEEDKSWHLTACRIPQGWDISMGSPDITIAIIDNGFNLTHPELKDKIVKPYNVWTRNQNVLPSQDSHGTHVAGIAVAQGNNGQGTAGVASDCMFMPVQVSNNQGIMTTTTIVDGVLYAIYQGADVINVSLGMSFDELKDLPVGLQQNLIHNNFKEEERLWNEVLKIAEQYNSTIIFAAGNDNVLTGIDPMQRPKNAINVSAVDKSYQPYSKSKFSNYGEYSLLSAPGVDIYSTIGDNNYSSMQGTSMAAPIVSGAVALLKSVDKNLTTQQIIDILVSTGLHVQGDVGKMIQMDKALEMARTGNIPPAPNDSDCERIGREIDSLKKEIEKRLLLCPQMQRPDTLKINDVTDKNGSINGKWKSTEYLYNDSGQKITVYFEFEENNGKMTLVEDNGNQCMAPLAIDFKDKRLAIRQTATTNCTDGKQYKEYTFTTYSDRGGYLLCEAQNTQHKLNRFKFYLIKTN